MRFRSHQCWFPKDAEFPGEYEDASARSEKHGRAIVADGVSSAIFSRAWARLLTRSAVAEPPDLKSEDAIQAWLVPLQQEWRKGINFAGLPWHQKPKATSIGAQTTLLMVAIDPLADGGDPAGEYRLRASGIGDCVLFLVRDGRKAFSFPLTSAAEFAEPPQIFSSIAKGIAYVDKFRHLDDRCRIGDLLVVCSDAVGLWAMEEYEAGREVDWMRYWENDEAWQADIQALRERRADEHGNRMRVDDCTLLLLQVVAEESLPEEPDVQPDRSDEPFMLISGAPVSLEGSPPSQAAESEAYASMADGTDAAAAPETAAGAERDTGEQRPEAVPGDEAVSDRSPSNDFADSPPSPAPESDSPASSAPSAKQPSADTAAAPSRTIYDYVDDFLGRLRGRD
jgi:hypothetical protein